MINVFEPQLTEDEILAVGAVIESGWVGPGEAVKEFEGLLSEYTGKRHVICCNSGATSLMLSILALDQVGKIAFPAYGMMAGANVARMLGKQVWLCDVGDDFCMNMNHDDGSYGVSTALFINHNGKIPYTQQRRTECWIIEDAAASLGIPGAFSYGDVCTTSFSPHKIITTGQGGAVLTDNDQIAESVRGFLDHGGQWRKTGIHCAGGNFRMSDINAAIGVSQMRRIDAIVNRRREIHKIYRERLGVDCGWCVILRSGCAKEIQAHLESCHIQSLMPYGKNCESMMVRDEFPMAATAANELLFLPSHNGLSDEEVEQVCDSTLEAKEMYEQSL